MLGCTHLGQGTFDNMHTLFCLPIGLRVISADVCMVNHTVRTQLRERLIKLPTSVGNYLPWSAKSRDDIVKEVVSCS